MDILFSLLLAGAAFLLGACPFSVWIGHKLLGKDITQYGDGNPGSANVFRAGSVALGIIALILDIGKGIPFVWLASSVFHLPYPVILIIGMCAILGHAFSPLLKFKGGKSIAVTFGVLIALPQHDLLFIFAIFTLLGFLFVEQNSWMAMMGPIGSSLYLLIYKGLSVEFGFIVCILILFTYKQQRELRTAPIFGINLLKWMHSREQKADIKKQNL
jgi:glycerol-3-phosphate acyltransferase PlsY